MVKVCGAVLPDVQEIDLVTLLLQGGQTAAHRGMLQRRGNNVFAMVALQPGDALDGKVVGFTGTGCIDDLGGLHIQTAGNALGGGIDGSLCGSACCMAGICIARAIALYFAKALQNRFVCRGIGGIIQIDHKLS